LVCGRSPPTHQSERPDLLEKVGRRIEVLLRDLPNLIAREKVVQTTVAPRIARRSQLFNYLIVFHRRVRLRLSPPSETANVQMEEYRTDLQNRRIGAQGSDPRAPAFEGFAFAWMRFDRNNQSESRFRYMGIQKVGGQPCFVVSFAQIPGKVKNPGRLHLEYSLLESVPLLYQGIAWIQASDYTMIRLQEDLLAPQPKINLLKLTTDVEFSEQHIAAAVSGFWLPRSANVEVLQVSTNRRSQAGVANIPSVITYKNAIHTIEKHSYSNYHRYEVDVKIGFSAYRPTPQP
jgi:hypothetical protein